MVNVKTIKNLAIITTFSTLLFIEGYFIAPKVNYLTMNSQIKNQRFTDAIKLSSLKYFGTMLIDIHEKSDFLISKHKYDNCISLPFNLSDETIFLCASDHAFQTADFNQLKATIDSPAVRHACRLDPSCSLPAGLQTYEKSIF